MLKEKLLSTTLFQDNEAFQNYLNLIARNITTVAQKGKTQKHHIFPKCLSKKLNLMPDNSAENLINLEYKDHIFAHYYLINATDDNELKAANIHAFNHLLQKQGHWLDEFALQDLLTKQQVLYEQTSYLRSEHSRRINSGGCYVHNGIKSKHIQFFELDNYLALGWQRGQIQNHAASRGRIVITNGINEKRVKTEDLAAFLAAGWSQGRITKGRPQPRDSFIVVHSPELEIERHIPIAAKDEFLEKGFILGGLKRKKQYKKCLNSQAGKATKNKIWIHKATQTKMILPEELTEYLANDWAKGRGKNN